MASIVPVSVHASQFPEQVQSELLASLRSRQINHKFHYDSLKQSQKWLALHNAYSPARTEADVAAAYDRSFGVAANRLSKGPVHVISLGCGGGQKDVRLLKMLTATGNEVFYTAADVSLALVLTAREAAARVLPESHCSGLVCDLAAAGDLPEVLSRAADRCLFTFFGMLPNFEPDVILPQLARLLRPVDWLLLSANLSPGDDYSAGLRHILPQYDNELTRDWLLTFLLDLGVEKTDGEIHFNIEDVQTRGGTLKRVTAYFHFLHDREIRVGLERFEFRQGENVRLFFSYRHTPALVQALVRAHGFTMICEFLAVSREEGAFLAKPAASAAS